MLLTKLYVHLDDYRWRLIWVFLGLRADGDDGWVFNRNEAKLRFLIDLYSTWDLLDIFDALHPLPHHLQTLDLRILQQKLRSTITAQHQIVKKELLALICWDSPLIWFFFGYLHHLAIGLNRLFFQIGQEISDQFIEPMLVKINRLSILILSELIIVINRWVFFERD